MNNYPAFFNNININNILNNIDFLTQEVKRLERKILNIEKNLMPPPIGSLKPTPIDSNASTYMNNSYTKENYMI